MFDMIFSMRMPAEPRRKCIIALLIGSFREEPGIIPGWHMNKAHLLSVALEAGVEDEKIRFLVDMSYELTKK